ncbi:hypothetical protein C8J57DRAFT_1308398 [Mycena rebaudengoi]|nr:hypothetical protein C8J57DRAFT_1308398 [Mycena rebaudengoi]
MASFNMSEVPNPLTPMVFLPPDIAHQVQIESYILVGTLGAYIWDILGNLSNDYKLLTSRNVKVGFPTGVYFFSRLLSLLYVLFATLFLTYPLKHCRQMLLGALILISIAVPANCLLFFLRARAIFDRNPYMITLFFVVWLGVLGSSATTPFALTGANIGPTDFCLTASAKAYGGAITIAPMIHDTIVFLTISSRLFANSHRNLGLKGDFRAFWTGEYLPQFSKTVLQDGQVYYLTAVAVNLLCGIMYYNQAVTESYRVMFTVSNVMITNCMACAVFRNTKFGYHSRVVTTSELMSRTAGSSIVMQRRPARSNTMLNGIQVTNVIEHAADDSMAFKKDTV